MRERAESGGRVAELQAGPGASAGAPALNCPVDDSPWSLASGLMRSSARSEEGC